MSGMHWSRRQVWSGLRAAIFVALLGLSGCASGSTARVHPNSGSGTSTRSVPNGRQRVYVIQGQNMARTLMGCPDCEDDHVLFDLVAGSSRKVRSGDIVVFHAPPGWAESTSTLVSRVIAVAGQTVKGDIAGRIMISRAGANGPYRTRREPYVLIDGPVPAFGPVTIPKGRLWVMGDHRSDSADSRYHCSARTQGTTEADNHCDPKTSTVAVEAVIGIAVKIISPPSRVRALH